MEAPCPSDAIRELFDVGTWLIDERRHESSVFRAYIIIESIDGLVFQECILTFFDERNRVDEIQVNVTTAVIRIAHDGIV